MHISVPVPPQVDERNITVGQAFSLRSCDARYFEAELDVRAHVKPGVEGRFLEDNDPLAAGPIDKPAIEERLASGRMIETGNDIEQRRLSAAGRPDDADEFPFIDRKRDAIDRQSVVAPRPEMAGGAPQRPQLAARRHPLRRRLALRLPWATRLPVVCFRWPTGGFFTDLLRARSRANAGKPC